MSAAVTIGVVVVIILVLVLCCWCSGLKIMREYERAVVFELGICNRQTKGPGMIFIRPFLDKMLKVDIRTQTRDVPKQDVITRDNVSVAIDAIVYFQVFDPYLAITAVQNYQYATMSLAATTLRAVCGQKDLDSLLTQREQVNNELRRILDESTDGWGIKVSMVEVQQLRLPSDMTRAMAKQAIAEREKRAKIIGAEGEFESSKKLSEAAEIMNQHPITVQLRFLQTLLEIAQEKNHVTVFPVPIELLQILAERVKDC